MRGRYSSSRKLAICLSILVGIAFIIHPTKAGIRNWRRRHSAAPTITKEEAEEEARVAAKREFVIDNAIDSCKAAYGCVFCMYGHFLPAQILTFTVMRASGYAQLERAMVELRRNVRQAIRSAVYNSPSLLLAHRALHDLSHRRQEAKNILEESRKAKQDGIVTFQEYRRISKLQRRQVKRLNRDMRRIKRGSSAVARIYRTLDLQEVGEVLRRLFFIVTAVLASGEGSSTVVSRAIFKYCHFWCLGSLLMEANLKLGLPISRLVVGHIMEPLNDDEIAEIVNNKNLKEPTEKEKKQLGQLQKALGTVIMYLLSAVLILSGSKAGVNLNAALLGSSLVIRSLATIWNRIETYDKEEDNDERDDAPTTRALEGVWGGIWTVLLTAVALYCGRLVDNGSMEAPVWLEHSFLHLEKAIDRLVVFADKIY